MKRKKLGGENDNPNEKLIARIKKDINWYALIPIYIASIALILTVAFLVKGVTEATAEWKAMKPETIIAHLNSIEKMQIQDEFNKLVQQTKNIVEQYYYPNLLLQTRYIPETVKSYIHQQIIKIQRLLGSKNKIGAEETSDYYKILGLYYSGNITTKIADADTAIKYFEEYLKINPLDSQVLTNVGVCYSWGKKDYNKALEYYNIALIIQPVYCRAHYNKAIALWMLEGQDKAMDIIDNYIENVPACAEAYFVKSLFKCQQGKIEEAINLMNIALEKGFNDISWMVNTDLYTSEFKRSNDFKRAINLLYDSLFIPQDYRIKFSN